jgi:subtilisin-like proprotein convertase family protein
VAFGPGGLTSTASYTVATGCPLTPGGTFTFSNPAPITIPDSGTATPYPSTINVSGLTGVVTKVTVTLNGFTHTWPDDVDVLLVGPGGQQCILMSDAGGSAAVSGVNLTFDDMAVVSLPDSTLITSGTYRPTNHPPNPDNFPAPGPGSVTQPLNPPLSVFNGTNPNGTWSLFVVDDFSGDAGNINGGWSITIQTGIPNCTTTASCAVLQNCRLSLAFISQAPAPSTCLPTYPSSLLVTATLTNTSALTISGIFVQVAALGYTVPTSATPPRLLTADGATCTSGGQVGAVQSTVNGQAPIGSNTPIGTLAPGQSVPLTFLIARANLPVQFSLNVFGIGGTACPVAFHESYQVEPVMATLMPLDSLGLGLLRDNGRLTVEPLVSSRMTRTQPGVGRGR